MKTYIVNFYNADGVCYFRSEAKHIDISTYYTIIDFSKTDVSETNVFRSFDEMQTIQVISNCIVITFISGQRITIATL